MYYCPYKYVYCDLNDWKGLFLPPCRKVRSDPRSVRGFNLQGHLGANYSAHYTDTWMSPFLLSRPGQIHQREQEIAELKQKIAEVMAVMPSLSYSSDGSNLSPVTPHYSSKFMDNSPSSLDPNASVYQPLKKWLWHPHFMPDRTLSLSLSRWSSRFQFGLFFWVYRPPIVFALWTYHIKTHT